MKPWQKYLLYASLVIMLGGLSFLLVETVRAKNTGFETKTLWDWMELLIIPVVLAGGAIAINLSEKNRERQNIEERAKLEREIAADRQQEAALQSYLDRMAELLLKEKLRTTKSGTVREVARTRTVSIMRGLDPKRNNLVIQFLREANLILEENSILKGANLESVNLGGINLKGVNLQGANVNWGNLQGALLDGANLQGALLGGTNLEGAILDDANLQETFLVKANLEEAILDGADLRGARLLDANLQHADLERANLAGADLDGVKLGGANLERAILDGALLGGANLERAILLDANLQRVDLAGANLQDADLERADLAGANLARAKITEDQLAKAKPLIGVTMPDGTRHD